jgi:hypothetical protein
MVFQSINLFIQSSPPQYGSDSPFKHELDNGAGNIQKESNPYNDKKNSENPPRSAQLMYFAVSHSGKRNDGHIQSIKKVPPFDDHISGYTQTDDDDH